MSYFRNTHFLSEAEREAEIRLLHNDMGMSVERIAKVKDVTVAEVRQWLGKPMVDLSKVKSDKPDLAHIIDHPARLRLSTWEREFVQSLATWRGSFTSKQQAIIERIHDKLERSARPSR